MLKWLQSDASGDRKDAADHEKQKGKLKQFMRLLRSAPSEEIPKAASPAVPGVVQTNGRQGYLPDNFS
jgi:hypothetical protein